MAEAVGLAASVIQLLGVTVKLSKYGLDYISGVRDAREDVRDLVAYLTALQQTLEPLERELRATRSYGWQESEPVEPLLVECRMFLERLEGELDGEMGDAEGEVAPRTALARMRGVRKRLKWPFKEKETQMASKRIERLIERLKLNMQIDERLQRQSREAIKWVLKEDLGTKHARILENREPDVGDWILEEEAYRRWRDGEEGEGRVLLGRGEAGVGKTVLCSFVLDDLTERRKQPLANIGVAHIYFDFAEQTRQTKRAVAAHFVKQLLYQLPKSQFPMEVIVEHQNNRDQSPSLAFLEKMLHSMSTRFERVFVVCDALDEMEQTTQRRQMLPFLQALKKAGFWLFLTTRPHPQDVLLSFRGEKVMELAKRTADEDVRTLVEACIRKDEMLQELLQESSSDLYTRVVNEVVDSARGIILIAKLNIEHIGRFYTEEDIIAALDDLSNWANVGHGPTTEIEFDELMDATYDRILKPVQGYPKANKTHAYRTLSWVGYAIRPITVEELRIAISIDIDAESTRQAPTIERLLDACQGLVLWDKEENTVRLVHFSARNYLDRHQTVPVDVRGGYRGLVCAVYISMAGPQSEDEIVPYQEARYKQYWDDKLPEFYARFPLLEYSNAAIATHLQAVDEEVKPSVTAKLMRFLKDRKWATTHNWWINGPTGYIIPDFSVLHIASVLGYVDAVKWILENETVDVNYAHPGHEEYSPFGLTPLELASIHDRIPVAELLLDAGAECNAAGHFKQAPVLLATKRSFEGMAKMLISHPRADVNVKDARNFTTLVWAAELGLEELTATLLAREDTEVNTVDNDLFCPLMWAINNGSQRIIKMFLDNPRVDVNLAPSPYTQHTPMMWACQWCKEGEGTVKLFVDCPRVDLHRKNKYGETALFYAVMRSKENHEVLEFLVGKRLYDLNEKSGRGFSVLGQACRYKGYEWAVGFLMGQEGVDVNTPCDVGVDPQQDDHLRGRTPVGIAAYNGCEDTVELLLGDERVDVNWRDADGKTPWELASGKGHGGITERIAAHPRFVAAG